MTTIRIRGIGNRTREALQLELKHGARFVVYEYVVSVFLFAFRVESKVYYIPPGESSAPRGLRYILYEYGFNAMTISFGTWGVPVGTIQSVIAIYHNLKGGRDVTHQIAPLLGLDAGEPPAVHPLVRVLHQDVGPRTDVKHMTRGDLLRSGGWFLLSAVVFLGAYTGLFFLARVFGFDPFEHVPLVFAAYLSLILGLLAVCGGLYLLVRGLFRSRRYQPQHRAESVRVVIE
jgi:hypothetical protein